jgi:lipoprotein signal peptidase
VPSNNFERKIKFRQWLGCICLLTLFDQASKAVIRTTILSGSRLPFIDNIIFITFIQNFRGFSWFVPILSDWFRTLFFVLRLIILAMAFPVYDFYFQSKQSSRWAWIALIAISAGITGNLLDDIFMPYTTDFIQIFHSPSANLADLFAYTGIGALAIEAIIQWKKKSPRWHGLRHFLTHIGKVRREFFFFLKNYFVEK